MSDDVKEQNSTPPEELRRQIMSYSEPKNEREWWAMHRIEQLEAALQRYVCWCKDVTATGAQVCTHGIPTTSLCGWEARKALEGKP